MAAKEPPYFKTDLHSRHLTLAAKMVPFAGWEMPLQYRGVFEEVAAVREAAGMFDVSHMGRLKIWGPTCRQFLNSLVTIQFDGLRPGQARYGFALNETGGIIDDLVAYSLQDSGDELGHLIIVCNAATRSKLLEVFENHAAGYPGLEIEDQTRGTIMIAVQGPDASEAIERVFPTIFELSSLPPFGVTKLRLDLPSQEGVQIMLSRTGYTGEDGYELVAPGSYGTTIWDNLSQVGVAPCGLASRDVLRLEAGLRLHGTDIDSSTTPLEAGLGRFISWDKGFIGKEALEDQADRGLTRCLVGFVMRERAIPRSGYEIFYNQRSIGRVTSGGHSSTLDTDIGMGYVSIDHSSPGTSITVDVRGRPVDAELVRFPFYKRIRRR